MLALILHVKFFESKRFSKLLASLFCSFYFTVKLNLTTGSNKCPECYGDELCLSFQSREIRLTWLGYFLTVINPNLTKGVFYGVMNGSEVVVKRKLGRTEENQLLTRTNFTSELSSLRMNPEAVQNVVFCPGFENLDFLFSDIKDHMADKKLWFDLRSSIEPLLLMYFQSDQMKWPVPRYYGACGDLIVEEYKGQSLANFLSAKFEMRASLAIHLLRMAHLFTFQHPTYSFYFTDYSFDNLVADSAGNIFLIDLDNVIVSNRTTSVGNLSSESVHTSHVFEEFKYAFSSTDICKHQISDHNFFSICKQYLLANGLLKEIPSELEESCRVRHFLSECSKPSTMSDRFSAAQQLQSLLEEIVSG